MKPNYVRVIIDRAIQREFDYSVPETLADRIGIGSRVRVPFRDKSALATVLATLEQSDAKGIRPIEALVGEAPAISASLLELAKWMSAYYCCPLETVMRSLLPQVIRRAEVGWKKQLFVQPLAKIDSDKIDNLRKRAPRQAELLEAIAKLEKPMPAAQLLRKTSFDNQTLRALAKRGLIDLREEAVLFAGDPDCARARQKCDRSRPGNFAHPPDSRALQKPFFRAARSRCRSAQSFVRRRAPR